MLRNRITTVALATLVTLGLATNLQAIDVVWDGGDGNWDDANWNGGSDLVDLVGVLDGADGWRGPNEGEEETLIISGPVTVTYDADLLGADFEMRQGSHLVIRDGAVWQQIATDDWAENRWTELDMTSLTLDNGTFRRIGSVREEGGGALIFGSWQGDDTFSEPDAPIQHMEADILITNGGRLENEGQLWFGGWDDTPANGTKITMTINDGTVDLTGGDVIMDENFEDPPANADLVFTNRFVDDFDQPTYAINFTGPGSITVDSSGIINAQKNEFGEWEGLDPITYEDLWNAGILQADGRSGVDGESFSNYFTVTGSLGADDYTLTYSATAVPGDFDNDGQLTAADIDMLSDEVRGATNTPRFDLNGDSLVDAADRMTWVQDLRNTYFGDSNLDGAFDSSDFVQVFQRGEYEDSTAGNSTWEDGDWNGDAEFDSTDFVTAFQAGGYEQGPRAAVASVPEPSSLVLLALSATALLGLRRRR